MWYVCHFKHLYRMSYDITHTVNLPSSLPMFSLTVLLCPFLQITLDPWTFAILLQSQHKESKVEYVKNSMKDFSNRSSATIKSKLLPDSGNSDTSGKVK